MSITQYNGGTVLAMRGKNCVAIASDNRFGVQAQMLSSNCPKIFPYTDKIAIGLAGLNSDVMTFKERLQFRVNMYSLREEREIQPSVFFKLVSSMLYEKRFGPYFIEPVIAGLTADNEPFLGSTDLIGAPVTAHDFVVAGTASEQLFGVCESFFKEDMEEEELFETISQCLLAGLNRDCLSGWGATVHIITPTRNITRSLKTRMD